MGKEPRRSQWSWQFFEKEVVLPEEIQAQLRKGEPVSLTVTSNAFNTAWNVQPSQPNYNAHGCCVNHWYKVPISLCPVSGDKKAPAGDYENKPSGGEFQTRFVH